MPITIREQLAPSWFSPPFCDGVEFRIRPLNQLDYHDCICEIGTNQLDRIVLTGKGIRAALGSGLLDWKGILDEKGDPLPCTQKNFERLPELVATLVAFQIIEISRLSDEQKKS